MSNSQIRQVRKTIGMLSSMVRSGEQHSSTSEKMVDLADKAMTDIEQRQEPVSLKRLLLAQQEYIDLLCKELDELAGLASSHGWKSHRVEDGKELRKKIEQLKAECQ